MITKYKTNLSKTKIEIVEVDRETEGSVWLGSNRRAKITAWECFYDTWEAAFYACMAKAERDLNHARRTLELAQGTLGNVKGMKQPDPKAKP